MSSRDDYLKRYLGGASHGGKKPKAKKKKNSTETPNSTRFKIIEDDVDVPYSLSQPDSEKADDPLSDDDDIRPVVELVNNKTEELKMVGKFHTSNWANAEGSQPYSPPSNSGPSTSTLPESPGPSTLPEPIETTTAISRKIRRKEPSEEQKKRTHEMEKKYAIWNKGQKQVQEREEKLAELAAEAAKPFARHRGDADLEEHLKNIEYNDDPMLEYMREKKKNETGEVSKPTYRGPWPPNRYGIPPGYRWDGVDRSNGFEVKLMNSKNIKKAEEEEYYKWSSGRFE